MQELIALAKAKPGELNFASSGVGAAAHLTMEMFESRTGIDMQHVPYKGTAGALQDTVGGRINVMFDVVGPLMPQVKAGNVKALAVTAKERIPAAADVPTMAEQGVPDFISGTWAGIVAPAGTPKEIVERVSAEVQKALRDPAMRPSSPSRASWRSATRRRNSGLRGRGDRPLGQGDQGRRISRWSSEAGFQTLDRKGSASVTCTPFVVRDFLLTWAVLDHLLDLLLHRLEVEGSRVLHRRIVDRRLRQLRDVLLDQDEAPELAGEEVVAVAEGAGVGGSRRE